MTISRFILGGRLAAMAIALAMPLAEAVASDLGGSRASIRLQHTVAVRQDYSFLRTAAQIREYVEKARLVEVVANEHLALSKVSFPYARPVVKLFIERLAAQYHAATGELLVVTSLTRPSARQPRNASPLSVHPAGMAVDFRVPATATAREWLEQSLLSLENGALVDATRERYPPHYHVAVFPEAYERYAEERMVIEAAEAKEAEALRISRTAAIIALAADRQSPVAEKTIPITIVALSTTMAAFLSRRRRQNTIGGT
jgi:hypothetical protein